MDLHYSEIAKKVDMANATVRVYMSRPEFSHIWLHRGIYYGITDDDLRRLRTVYEARGWSGRRK